MFFGYTKQWKNKKFIKALTMLKGLKNVVIRASVDDQIGYDIPETWSKCGVLEDTPKDKKHFICKCNVKCDECGFCFDKTKEDIEVYFPKH